MNYFVKIVDKAADVSGYLSGWLAPMMVVLVAFEVFMRYVLHNPPMVADEFSAYMLVALSYVGLSYTWRQGGHVRITLLVSRLPDKAATWIRLIGDVGFVPKTVACPSTFEPPREEELFLGLRPD